MDRERFEQLVSQWLDQRDDAALRAEIERCAADSAELDALLVQWQSLDRLIRAGLTMTQQIAWERLGSRLRAAVAESGAATGTEVGDADDRTGAALDRALAALPGVEQRVDWARYRERVGAAVREDAGQAERPRGDRRDEAAPRVIRFPLRRVALGLLGAAAAAAILVAVFLPPALREPVPLAAPTGFARLAVSGVVASAAGPDGVAVAARVTVSGPAGESEPPRLAAIEPEIFLMIDPRPVRGAMEALGPSGTH